MKEVTNLMINKYKILELGYDFMGYTLKSPHNLTFHHLIIPRRNNGPYEVWNGAILLRKSHDYLHLIERYDYDIFCYLTSEMIDMNIKGKLDVSNLRNINDLLKQFEYEHCYETTKKGKQLIKEEYTKRIKL